jgi:hypothetical protein
MSETEGPDEPDLSEVTPEWGVGRSDEHDGLQVRNLR